MPTRAHVAFRHFLAVLFILCAMLFSLSANCRADLAFGLGYPFISMKYAPDYFPYLGVETKYAFGDTVSVLAARGYINFIKMNKLHFYTAYEYGYLYFEKGSGKEYGGCLGIEIRPNPKMGLALDIAPTIIDVYSREVGLKEMEWIATVCFYFHPF